jgi:hypothetical protein
MHPISGVFASKPPKILLLGLLITYHCLSPSLADKFAVFIQGTTIEDKSLVLPVRDIRLANAIHNSFNPEGHLDMVPTDIVKKILEPLPYNLRMGINPI